MNATPPWVAEVNRFWFEEKEPEDWFGGGPVLDAEIRDRFAKLHRELAAQPPAAETLAPEAATAAVIVLDQFPRNIFRGQAAAFATDTAALALAKAAVERGLDATLGQRQRQFLYLPFMHAEDPAAQARSVELFTGLGDPEVLDFAVQHRNVIARFGRFPGRNAALGRVSSEEEQAFLASGATKW